MERHICKTAWRWQRNVYTSSSIYELYKKICCDIKCAFVGCHKNNIYIHIMRKAGPFANTIAGEYKVGFRQTWSTMDQVFTEKQILMKCWERNIYVIHICTTFQQACDSIDGAVTQHIMREFRIPPKNVKNSTVNNKTYTGMCQNTDRIFTLLWSYTRSEARRWGGPTPF